MNRSRYTLCYETLRSWLKAKRNEKGLSIRDLAGRLDITHTVVGKVEHGDRKIDFIEFIEFCRAMDVDPHEGVDLIVSELDARKQSSS